MDWVAFAEITIQFNLGIYVFCPAFVCILASWDTRSGQALSGAKQSHDTEIVYIYKYIYIYVFQNIKEV